MLRQRPAAARRVTARCPALDAPSGECGVPTARAPPRGPPGRLLRLRWQWLVERRQRNLRALPEGTARGAAAHARATRVVHCRLALQQQATWRRDHAVAVAGRAPLAPPGGLDGRFKPHHGGDRQRSRI